MKKPLKIWLLLSITVLVLPAWSYAAAAYPKCDFRRIPQVEINQVNSACRNGRTSVDIDQCATAMVNGACPGNKYISCTMYCKDLPESPTLPPARTTSASALPLTMTNTGTISPSNVVYTQIRSTRGEYLGCIVTTEGTLSDGSRSTYRVTQGPQEISEFNCGGDSTALPPSSGYPKSQKTYTQIRSDKGEYLGCNVVIKRTLDDGTIQMSTVTQSPVETNELECSGK